MTPPKSAAARDAASQDFPSAAPLPLPFAPAKANQPTAQQAAAHDVVPLTPAAHPPTAAQTVQFSPARPAPGPGPHPVPPPAAPPPAAAPAAPSIVVKRKRSGATRTVVLFVIPLIALALGFVWWLHSGRYVTTDNAYVGADKVLITPQVSGAIVAVHVVEGQKVKVGDPLFDIDPQPYQIALALAKGRLEAAKVEFANLRSSYVSNADQIKMGEDAVTVRQADFDRKNALATARHGNHRRPRHLDGHSHPGKAAPRIREPAAGDDDGQARRRSRRADRQLPRLHSGESRA